MSIEKHVNHLNSDSVQSLDDMKTCMRQNEASTNYEFEEIYKLISLIKTQQEVEQKEKRTNRFINLASLFIACSALIIVIALSIGVQIIERFLR